jgi:hypothetical protein
VLKNRLGKSAVVSHATGLHKGRIGRETLNVTIVMHVKHAFEVSAVGKHLDRHVRSFLI